MGYSVMSRLGMLAVAAAVVSATGIAAGQGAQGKRTPWGDPDLEGIWNHGTITPLERPERYADREFLTEKEVAEINNESETRADRREGLSKEADVGLAYNQIWWDRGLSIGRTSLIVDPPNGRLPALTPEAKQKDESPEARRLRRVRQGDLPANGPEDMDLGDRCILYRPVPVTASGYNNHVRIVQSQEYVAIVQEQIHDVRIIPIDRRPHLPPQVRQWLGDSRGHWEGNTLVVETTNFSEKTDFQGSAENRHVVERLTRTDSGTIEYKFTVTDPTRWTRPWTGLVPWTATEGPMYEYACHEGNYGMLGILRSSRAQEKVAAATGSSN
jgi:hypothetical protein